MQAAALCVTGALLAVVVRRGSAELALVVTLGAVVVVLLLLSAPMRELMTFWKEIGQRGGLSPKLLLPLYKTIGIAVVVKVGGDLCRDAGESALASALETVGSVCALLVALPLLSGVLTLLMEFMR